jgi:L-amino acid N-acyltransferase
LKALFQTGENAGIHTAIARITEGNEASISLFRQEGFENVGVMKEVGRKFDRLLDVFVLQKIFESKNK